MQAVEGVGMGMGMGMGTSQGDTGRGRRFYCKFYASRSTGEEWTRRVL